MKRNPAFVKLTQWEHWPTFMYYVPLFPFLLLRSVKAGHPFFTQLQIRPFFIQETELNQNLRHLISS